MRSLRLPLHQGTPLGGRLDSERKAGRANLAAGGAKGPRKQRKKGRQLATSESGRKCEHPKGSQDDQQDGWFSNALKVYGRHKIIRSSVLAPFFPVPDGRLLAQQADTVLQVTHWDVTSRWQGKQGL